MTRRDFHWRLAGVALFAGAAGLGLASNTVAVQSNAGVSAALGLIGFLLYLSGVVLVTQGERLPRACKARRVDARELRSAARPGSGPSMGDGTRR